MNTTLTSSHRFLVIFVSFVGFEASVGGSAESALRVR